MLHEFRTHGDSAIDAWSERMSSSPWGRAPSSELAAVGTPDLRALEERFIPATQQRDYDATFGRGPTRRGQIRRAGELPEPAHHEAGGNVPWSK